VVFWLLGAVGKIKCAVMSLGFVVWKIIALLILKRVGLFSFNIAGTLVR
jgi:hypothetical protein